MIRLILLSFSLSILSVALPQSPNDLIDEEHWALSYSGFRKGQHPDRGDGAKNPSESQIIQDLNILLNDGFKLIRMYDCDTNTQMTLEVIRKHSLPIKVLLGIWLDAEISNHDGCSWLTEPIPDSHIAKNRINNEIEVNTAIELANNYNDIVIAVNVGNEALVSWNDHMMSEERVIQFVREVKTRIDQPVTVAETHYWWRDYGANLAKELDFLGVHIYPLWEGEGIETGMLFTIEGIEKVMHALPDAKIAILEAGWATTANEFGKRSNEINQKLYYDALKEWAKDNNVTVFFFEAFDEPWKGNDDMPNAAEKNWGVYFENRTPKLILQKN
jgi:exo-beta-1,3-glucanase (GH17 family)|tara:strand:- start:1881 stop:2870 length:990 start_codon:yes stop_codon:yes gene_type:complete